MVLKNRNVTLSSVVSKLLLCSSVFLGLVSCAPQQGAPPEAPHIIDPKTIIIKSRATINLTVGDSSITSSAMLRGVRKLFQPFMIMNALATSPQSSSVSVTVTNAPSTTMVITNTNFVPPTITNSALDFGYLQITALQDNQLNLCGSSNTQKCTRAFIRVYTSGSYPGLYNSVDAYSAPITAGQRPSAAPYTVTGVVGSGASNALVLEYLNNGTSSTTIPTTQHVINLNHFPIPKFEINSDFTEAGAGTYMASLVLEYVLAP